MVLEVPVEFIKVCDVDVEVELTLPFIVNVPTVEAVPPKPPPVLVTVVGAIVTLPFTVRLVRLVVPPPFSRSVPPPTPSAKCRDGGLFEPHPPAR